MKVKDKYKAVCISILALPLPFWMARDKIQLTHTQDSEQGVKVLLQCQFSDSRSLF